MVVFKVQETLKLLFLVITEESFSDYLKVFKVLQMLPSFQ